MRDQLLNLALAHSDASPLFLEGVVLAANMAMKPLAPESWLADVFGEDAPSVKKSIEAHIHQQYNALKRNEYSLLALLTPPEEEQFSDFSAGFMTLWPVIEPQWREAAVGDGTLRMLQAMLTTMMLAIDESQTQAQMMASGIDTPPALADLLDAFDLMINEVAQAADAVLVGSQSQRVNPFKHIGRNDDCLCGSGKKFKQCCGQ
ncbi:SEC-C metal-binding domain-containing protein [Vibrio ostreicida]|uniref:SEC-C metal-binding domain-containing protein n=1 Tax=Vibrio ostreicida TaxID=526588 RepID=A0ABT8BWM3_9VIBR|nr:SEC-C metal-binding domain-containing protein [Vibrio ostreicida]MDN3610535.1 SEC-C metal-binding domain-containing protein [Vibrio ostreicida]NPD07464.1 UPF0149 family protein [Vibrio ostreicida]